MRVRIRLFAMLRERAGTSELSLELPDGARVRDALAAPAVAVLAGGVPLVMAVNREYADPDAPLAPDDELALIPPVSGGAGDAPPPREPVAGAAGAPGAGTDRRPRAGAAGEPAATDRLHVAVREEPLSLDALAGRVRDPRAGAVVTFSGVTREVDALVYEAYAEMALERMRAIVAEAIARHGLCASAAEHRVGRVPLSEPSVIVAASAPHRPEAFAGAREIIDRIKALAPLWKQEHPTGAPPAWIPGALPGA
jgi:molybdopterin converting factor subunit 1